MQQTRMVSLLLIAASSSIFMVDGFSTTTTTSPLHHQQQSSSNVAAPTTLWAIQHHATGNAHLMRHKHVHFDDDEDEECDLTASSSSSTSTTLPAFSHKKTELRLDGLEPYVVVSAITSTTSFGVVTGGNLFTDSSIFAGSDSIFQEFLRVVLLANNMASSCLGLYALGIFSFTIMYCKAALARQESSREIYQDFFDDTEAFRYKGYQAFVLSLILLVADIFLFGLAYLPEPLQPVAALASAPVIHMVWKDWQAIISRASVIYTPPTEAGGSMAVTEEETSPVSANKIDKQETEQNGAVNLKLDKSIGVITTSL